jgi:hypothetical protein
MHQDFPPMNKVSLHIFPSTGTIQVAGNSWGIENKSWVVTSSLEKDISLSFQIDRLKASLWHEISANGNKIGSFQSNPSGVLTFSNIVNFSKKTMFLLKEPLISNPLNVVGS